MSEENREQRYLRLLQAEKDAFERASNASETGGPRQREALARDWFAASARLLKEHAHSNAVPDHGGPLQPYPGDAIRRFVNLAEALAAGRLPQPILDLTAAGGRPERWPGERKDVATALHYIARAKAGEVKDHRYVVTVCNAFSVDRSTVRDWQRRRDEIVQDMQPTPPELFPDALLRAGARYHFNRTGEQTEGVE